MRAHVYQRGKRWETRWQTSRRFATEAEARAAAELPYPPPPKRTPRVSDELRALILRLADAGLPATTIAAGLTWARIPTASGRARWSGATISYVVERERERRDAADKRAVASEWRSDD